MNTFPTGSTSPASQFPSQGFHRMAARMESVLLICYYDPAGISTVPETVAFMQSASVFSVTVLNLFEHRQDTGHLKLHPWINLDAFAAVVIHNTVSYNVDNLRSLDLELNPSLSAYSGVKVLMKQDENFRFREVAEYVGRTRFDLVFTCLPDEAVPLVYPVDAAGSPRFERMLTGYVTPTLRNRPFGAGARPIDIGYRGSIQPLSFGWLAYEKRKIGDDVARLLESSGMALDISSRWEDRLGGDAWFDFLGDCKATLGAESGASIFDLDGDLDARCAALEKQFRHLTSDAGRAEAVLAGIKDLEGNVHYNQVSPRHFEAAACGAVQILYPGTYSGLLVPGRHYFQLERDYSNLDEAVALVRDEPRRLAMARAAFEEVVQNPANWIETFVARVDGCIVDCLRAKRMEQIPEATAPAAHHVLLIAAHDPVIDPRLGWIEEGALPGMLIHQLGVLRPEAVAARADKTARGGHVLAYPRKSWIPGMADEYLKRVAHSPAGMAGAQELLFLERALQLGEGQFCELFGAPAAGPRNADFRWYLRYLLDTAASLVERAGNMRGVQALIATDLDTMPAALILKGMLGVPLLYDAHEYWPEADPSAFEYEKQFWISLERRMVAHADRRQTVSPGLAGLMTRQYDRPFETVPNCEPVDRALPDLARHVRADGTCHFLFQGNFAVGRGLDLMIEAWAKTDERAILQLRGPDNAYKEKMITLAKATGLMGKRILFPPAVSEGEMIVASAQADVGVIPYARTGTTYRHCCPNKMSQYMAAGLPILANATDFVSSVVRDAGCGEVVDFSRAELFVLSISRLCSDSELRVASAASGRAYFESSFNWNAVSADMYQWLSESFGKQSPAIFAAFELAAPRFLVEPLPVQSAEAPWIAGLPPAFLPSPTYRAARSVWRLVPLPVRKALAPMTRKLHKFIT